MIILLMLFNQTCKKFYPLLDGINYSVDWLTSRHNSITKFKIYSPTCIMTNNPPLIILLSNSNPFCKIFIIKRVFSIHPFPLLKGSLIYEKFC